MEALDVFRSPELRQVRFPWRDHSRRRSAGRPTGVPQAAQNRSSGWTGLPHAVQFMGAPFIVDRSTRLTRLAGHPAVGPA
jgi:hypothetical protein